MKDIFLRRRLSEESINYYYQIQAEQLPDQYHMFCTRDNVLGFIHAFRSEKIRFKVLIREGAYHRYEVIFDRVIKK